MIYGISYKTMIGEKPLRITLYEVDGFIIVYDGTRHLVLSSSDDYDISSHDYAKIKVDSYDYLPLQKSEFA